MTYPIRTLFAGLLAAGLMQTASATTIVVDVLDDNPSPSVCTLRSALAASTLDQRVDDCPAGSPGMDDIRFRPGLSGILSLNANLTVAGPVTIRGPGRDVIAIGGSRVIEVKAGSGGDVALTGLEFQVGVFVGPVRTLRIEDARFEQIAARMSAASAVQIQARQIREIEIVNTEFSYNSGALAALALTSDAGLGRLSIRESQFVGNQGKDAGALSLFGAAPTEIAISDTLLAGNSGWNTGAIYHLGAGSLDVDRTLFWGNRAQGVGALFFDAQRLRLRTTAFLRNRGGLESALAFPYSRDLLGSSEISFSSFVDNYSDSGGATIALRGEDPVLMRGNLFRSTSGFNCAGSALGSLGHNIEIDADSCRLHGGNDLRNHYLPLYMVRAPMGAYTAALPAPDPADSGAVDGIPDVECADAVHWTPLTLDLRMAARPAWFYMGPDPGAPCDVGAVELTFEDTLYPLYPYP